MRESIANSMVFSIMLTFVIVLIIFLAGSTSYTKAFNVKNLIIDTIEEYHGWSSAAQNEIDSALSEMGYRIYTGTTQNCKTHGGTIVNSASHYRYCVEEFNTYKGKYYKVQSFMYFDIPVINTTLELGVSGETKIIGIIE